MAQFAFELRYFDAQKAKEENGRPDYFTKKLLSYKVITSPIWEAILTSNHYVEKPNPPGETFPRMIVDPKVQFKMNLGKPSFRCEDKLFEKEQGRQEYPKVVSFPNEELLEKIKGKSFFGKLKEWAKSDSKSELITTWK